MSLKKMTPALRKLALPQYPTRTFVSSRVLPTAWSPGPAPPRLPKDEQQIYEQLQKQSTGAFSTPRAPLKLNQSPNSSPQNVTENGASTAKSSSVESEVHAKVDKGDELHPHVRRGAKPEFEGEINQILVK